MLQIAEIHGVLFALVFGKLRVKVHHNFRKFFRLRCTAGNVRFNSAEAVRNHIFADVLADVLCLAAQVFNACGVGRGQDFGYIEPVKGKCLCAFVCAVPIGRVCKV